MLGHFSEQLWSDYCSKMRLGVIGGVSAGSNGGGGSMSRVILYPSEEAHIGSVTM